MDNQREKDNFPKEKKLQSINNNSYQISFQVNFRKLILSIEKNNNEKKKQRTSTPLAYSVGCKLAMLHI